MLIIQEIRKFLRPLKSMRNKLKWKLHLRNVLPSLLLEIKKTENKKRIFYLGIAQNANYGDNAQYYCISKWIKKHYHDYYVLEVDAGVIVDKHHKWLDYFVEHFNEENDIIIFQSGYGVQDLGGDQGPMHELICDRLENAKILMMPQTIYFREEKNKERVARNLNKVKRMLFLARDRVSYDEAIKMFPDLKVELYPDIVTTLIGHFHFKNKRNGIFLCTRNDGEKFYTYQEINSLKDRLQELTTVHTGDTQYQRTGAELRLNLEDNLRKEIEKFSNYQLVITDRYHGTIFSLCANTPVIIIRSNDHKVTTGALWFEGVYDNYVYQADNLDEAFLVAKKILHKFNYVQLAPYFEAKYYDHLSKLFDTFCK